MQCLIIGQSVQSTNALLKIFVQKTKRLILLLTHWSLFIRHGLTGQFQIITRIFSINPVSIFLNRGKRELRWNKQADIFLTRRYWKNEISQTYTNYFLRFGKSRSIITSCYIK